MDFRKLLRQAKADAVHERNNIPKKVQEKQSTDEQKESTAKLVFAFSPRTVLNLEDYAVPSCHIKSIYYMEEWINEVEEASILEHVHAAPSSAWVELKARRLQVHGGLVTTSFTPSRLPQWLCILAQSFVDAGVFHAKFTPNHALINDYAPGEEILPHEDGPMYYPLVAIISTGATGRMTFRRHRNTSPQDAPFYLNLARRSLLIFTHDAYTDYLHSIDNVGIDNSTAHRISLTIRHVPTA
ncbi:alkylated DNA repair protein alkB [Thraustotheca clavata]|uniref:Alkylated DNA repair protein alkB n=1 Tax=Thraustotheca clavata TaxID=74557 RepID=A0A1V9ZXR0_9STRA|nr:alkylated DNA repair protein alkB [Thraustotheca clavata]